MVTPPDDADLLKRYARAGDETAFAELVQRYLGLVYHAALRQTGGKVQAAEDVTQAVFSRLARKAPSLAGHQALAGWLHTTTRYAASETMRAERRRRAREQEAYTMQEISGRDHDESPMWENLHPVIDEALGELDERDREVVLLRYFAGLPHAQIGARLALTENAARMRVERALEKLHALLARRGITSTAAALGMALASQAGAASSMVPVGLTLSVTNTALAAGVTTAGAAVGFMGFMSTTKLSVVTAIVVLFAAALGVAINEIKTQREVAAAAIDAARDVEGRVVTRRTLEGNVRAAEQAAVDLRGKLAEARAAKTTATPLAEAGGSPPAGTPTTVWDPAEQGAIFMARHPAVRQALEDYAKARARFRYAALLESAGLSADKVDELVMFFSRGVGMGASGPDGPYANRSLSLVSGPRLSGSEYSERFQSLLGNVGAEKITELLRTDPARELTTKVAGELWSTDTPLTPRQSDELVRILTKNRSTQAALSGSRIAGYDWNAILGEARGVLVESQLAVLSGMQAREQFTQAINRRTPSSSANAPGASPLPRK